MRVITFSRNFPTGHPRAGRPTHFVQKILLSLIDIGHISTSKAVEIARQLDLEGMQSMMELRSLPFEPKFHTIRAGNRRKEGDWFSPRVWSGRPYNSKQIEFAPAIQIQRIWSYEVDENGVPSINGKYTSDYYDQVIAQHDGLSLQDFNDWLIMPCFRKARPFSGQVICWNKDINY